MTTSSCRVRRSGCVTGRKRPVGGCSVDGRIGRKPPFFSRLNLNVPGRKLGSMCYFTYLEMGINGIYWGYTAFTNPLILTSWDIQVEVSGGER